MEKLHVMVNVQYFLEHALPTKNTHTKKKNPHKKTTTLSQFWVNVFELFKWSRLHIWELFLCEIATEGKMENRCDHFVRISSSPSTVCNNTTYSWIKWAKQNNEFLCKCLWRQAARPDASFHTHVAMRLKTPEFQD